jgi:uncharacterized protein YbjT (DUF2867 family)
MIAIAGATGYIGGRLAPRLLRAGHPVRCLVRSPRKLQDRKWAQDPDLKPRLEIATTDLEDFDSTQAGLQGCDVAYYLVHSMISAAGDYAQQDAQFANRFGRAAKAAGVQRIVYLGGLGEIGEDLSEHLASRREVESALKEGGVPVTVLRAAMIIGSGSASFEILRHLVQRLPVMITPKWVSTLCQPIAIDNVLTYLEGVLQEPETVGSTFDIGGSEVLPYRRIMEIMADELKLGHRWIIPVPVLTPMLSSYWIHLVTPISHNIARPLAEGLKNPVVCREDRITKLIPQRLLNVREAIAAALLQIEAREVETNWSMAGPIPGDPDWAGGTAYKDEREMEIAAPAWAVFDALGQLGGSKGWYGGRWLWKLRGWIDIVFGGPGLRRGRRHPKQIGFGEAVDFWRVVAYETNKRFALRAEMRVPGEALLDFRIDDLGESSILHQTAMFQPRGLLGVAYWYFVLPFHNFVFQRLISGIARDAKQIAVSAAA